MCWCNTLIINGLINILIPKSLLKLRIAARDSIHLPIICNLLAPNLIKAYNLYEVLILKP
jgi:hypothetical protein